MPNSQKKKMKKVFELIFFLFIFFFMDTEAQLPSNTTGYGCNITTSQYPCRAYLLYRAHPPDFLDLAAVADLFSLPRSAVAGPSNISSPAAPLAADQPLLVPVSCSCSPVNDTSSLSYANVSYTIKQNDTFYLVSTEDFQNLTTYQSVEVANPTLVPTNLSIGEDVVFPIFCKCPEKTTTTTRYFVSYVVRPSDTLESVASFFGVSVRSIVEVNGREAVPSDTVFVPVSRLPELSQPAVVVSPPPGRPVKNDGKQRVVAGLSAGLLLVFVCGAWLYRETTAKSASFRGSGGFDDNVSGANRKRNDKTYNREMKREMEESLMADVSGCLDKYRVFGIEEIEEATDGFHENCLVQGSVYKGVVDGHVFAIKKMNWNASEELKILQKVNHGNLVKLEGFCIDPANAECYLIYEFVENGSLDSWLHGGENGKLSWKTRLRIAVDVANGLQYIHEHTRPRVVHKDIKSSNILLDSNMRAKIANFGLAKSGCNAITTHIVGTQGYISPEYLRDGVVSTKMDIFSFGVVLLELVSGREVVDEKGRVLWVSAEQVMEGAVGEGGKAKRMREFVDRGLLEETCSMESLMSVTALALACIHRDPSKRPSMVDIVYALCKSDDLFCDISDDTLSDSQVTAR